jgi:hypothetical protein
MSLHTTQCPSPSAALLSKQALSATQSDDPNAVQRAPAGRLSSPAPCHSDCTSANHAQASRGCVRLDFRCMERTWRCQTTIPSPCVRRPMQSSTVPIPDHRWPTVHGHAGHKRACRLGARAPVPPRSPCLLDLGSKRDSATVQVLCIEEDNTGAVPSTGVQGLMQDRTETGREPQCVCVVVVVMYVCAAGFRGGNALPRFADKSAMASRPTALCSSSGSCARPRIAMQPRSCGALPVVHSLSPPGRLRLVPRAACPASPKRNRPAHADRHMPTALGAC